MDELKIEAPKSEQGAPRYDQECRAALKPAFETLLEAAAEAGWNSTRAAYELMYLASHRIAQDREQRAEEEEPAT